MPAKYKNKKVTVDNIKFDSMREASHYRILKGLESKGAIRDLKLQVRIPVEIGGVKIKYESGRQMAYVCDFVYIETVGDKKIYLDSKGYKTKDYKMKKALMSAMGINITEW